MFPWSFSLLKWAICINDHNLNFHFATSTHANYSAIPHLFKRPLWSAQRIFGISYALRTHTHTHPRRRRQRLWTGPGCDLTLASSLNLPSLLFRICIHQHFPWHSRVNRNLLRSDLGFQSSAVHPFIPKLIKRKKRKYWTYQNRVTWCGLSRTAKAAAHLQTTAYHGCNFHRPHSCSS